MKARKMFNTIETHTQGHPCRTVVSGLPHIPGSTMQEKFTYMQEKGDWFRKLLSYEPRGNEIMGGTIITNPCTEGTDVGILYYEASCWLPMCGASTIGVATALIETGMVNVTEPITNIKFDTPAGVVAVEARVENGVAKEVSFINAPALVLVKDAKVDTKEFGSIDFDVSWGGNVYAIVEASKFDIDIKTANIGRLVEIANSIAKDMNEQIAISHPLFPFVNKITHVQFFGPPKSGKADIQNCVVALPKVVDRSPCGTGTCAKAALLFNEGKLKVGESFTHESVIGATFKCEVVEETSVEGIQAVYPKVTSSANIMGFATWILDPDDPFQEGFLLI